MGGTLPMVRHASCPKALRVHLELTPIKYSLFTQKYEEKDFRQKKWPGKRGGIVSRHLSGLSVFRGSTVFVLFFFFLFLFCFLGGWLAGHGF